MRVIGILMKYSWKFVIKVIYFWFLIIYLGVKLKVDGKGMGDRGRSGEKRERRGEMREEVGKRREEDE